MIVDIVFAVNWPPHAPAPGQATPSSSFRSSAEIFPAAYAADALVDVCDRDFLAAEEAGRDRSGVEHDARDVEPAERHHRGGVRLVAGDEADEPVEQVAARDELDRVGDHLARDERRAHALGAHRDAVGDRDRVELHRRPPASRTPRLTSCASSRWLRLHGIVSIQVVATPISGLARSSSVNPTPSASSARRRGPGRR
jgi:hypothetical protein